MHASGEARKDRGRLRWRREPATHARPLTSSRRRRQSIRILKQLSPQSKRPQAFAVRLAVLEIARRVPQDTHARQRVDFVSCPAREPYVKNRHKLVCTTLECATLLPSAPSGSGTRTGLTGSFALVKLRAAFLQRRPALAARPTNAVGDQLLSLYRLDRFALRSSLAKSRAFGRLPPSTEPGEPQRRPRSAEATRRSSSARRERRGEDTDRRRGGRRPGVGVSQILWSCASRLSCCTHSRPGNATSFLSTAARTCV